MGAGGGVPVGVSVSVGSEVGLDVEVGGIRVCVAKIGVLVFSGTLFCGAQDTVNTLIAKTTMKMFFIISLPFEEYFCLQDFTRLFTNSKLPKMAWTHS